MDRVKESSHDINNLSDNEFHNLLEEAFSMTSVKLHDKSPMLQKLLHEVKPDDDDLKTNIKQKIGVSGVRSALGKKRPERKRCKEESKCSAASRTTQGGSLQNLNRKLDCGEIRLKNKLQKSGSLNCFTVVTDDRLQVTKNSGGSVCSVAAAGVGNYGSGFNVSFEKKSDAKKNHVETGKPASYSSYSKMDSKNMKSMFSECDYTISNCKNSDFTGSDGKLACKDELVPTDDTSAVVSWDGEVYPPGTRDIEMMDLENSDDEHEHSVSKLSPSFKNISRTTVANCYSVTEQQDQFSSHSGASLIKSNAVMVDEVDAAINLPLGNKFHSKEAILLPTLSFQERPKSDFFSARTFKEDSTLDFKGSNGRSSLDVNGNPLSEANNRTGFYQCGRKESSEVTELNPRKTKRTKSTQKEMKAGDVRGNIGNLSIDELVEYITSADKKGKTTKNLLNDNKKTSLKNNKLCLPRIRKNEKENNKRNLPGVEFTDLEVTEIVNSFETMSDSLNIDKPNTAFDIACRSNKENRIVNETDLLAEAGDDSGDHIRSGSNTQCSSCCDIEQSEADIGLYAELPKTSEISLAEEAGFHIVTKKQRRNRFSSKSNNGAYHNERVPDGVDRSDNECDLSHFGWHYNQKEIMLLAGLPLAHCSQRSCIDTRRKSTSSVPPSDHSSVDNSDLDSVHSLPVKSTTVRPVITKTSSSSSCTPQASYADIAKMSMHPLQRHHLPVDNLPKNQNTLSIVEHESLLDSLCSASLDNKRDASTSTSEDGRSSAVQYEGLRNSLSHAASYPSLAAAASSSNESNLATQTTSASVTISCETFYRINSSFASKTPSNSLIFQCISKEDNVLSDKSIASSFVNTTPKELLAHVEADVNFQDFVFLNSNECANDDGYTLPETTCSYEVTKLHKSKSLDESSLDKVASSQCYSNSINKWKDKSGAAASVLSRKYENTVISRSQEKASVKEKKKSQTNKVLPAVIILHKHEPLPNDIEVTFGFEINEQLLLMSEQKCQEIAKDNKAATPMQINLNRLEKKHGSVGMPLTGSCDDCSELKFQNGPTCASTFTNITYEPTNNQKMIEDSGSFNYSHVVHYITETWDVVIREFEEGHNLSDDQQHAKIQYYSGQ